VIGGAEEVGKKISGIGGRGGIGYKLRRFRTPIHSLESGEMSRGRVVVIEDDIDVAATLLDELVGRD